MKKRRISLLLILAMACSLLLVPVGAVDVMEDASLSTYAGKTMTCRVDVVDFSGNFTDTYTVNIPIPKQATTAQQANLVQSAAMNTFSSTRSGIFEEISYEAAYVAVTPNYEPWVGGGRLAKAYRTIMVQVDGLRLHNNPQKLLVRMTNQSQPGYNFYTDTDRIYGADAYVLFIQGNNYGSPALTLNKDDVIDVYISSSNGGISIQNCIVSGSIYTG